MTSQTAPVRYVSVLWSPRATYAAVTAQARWLGAAVIVLAIAATATFAFLSTDVGKQAMFNQQLNVMESLGMTISDATYDRIEENVDKAAYTGPLGQTIGLSCGMLIVAGVLLVVFNVILGGDATFRQVLAVVTHSWMVFSVAQLFRYPLAYARQAPSAVTSLGVFVPFLDDATFVARALASVDLFTIWWIASLSIGLAVLYKRRTKPIAVALIATYVVTGVVAEAVKAALSAT